MQPTQVIHARIDPALKASAEAVFARVGLTTSDAIRLFFKQVEIHQGLPFDVRIPNKETRKALKEVRERKNLIKSNLADLRREFE